MPRTPKDPPPQIVGKRNDKYRLDLLKPNDWNPNKMTERQMESLKFTFRTRGWIASEALLVWATDERGRKKNTIINGEHRWTAALEVGFTHGPVVLVERITRAQAMAMTVFLDNNRGKFEESSLATVLKELNVELGSENLALELGFEEPRFLELLKTPPLDLDGSVEEPKAARGSRTVSSNTASQTVPLYFKVGKEYDEFTEKVRKLGERWNLDVVGDVVSRALTECLK